MPIVGFIILTGCANSINTAIKNNDIREIVAFIDNRSDVNEQDSDGATPLLMCAYYNKYEICKLLLENRADPTYATYDNNITPLHWAAANENVELIKLLLKYDADIDAKTKQHETALIYGVKSNKLDSVKILLSQGSNPNIRNVAGDTSLHIAARNLNGDIIKMLIDNNADVSIMNNSQQNAFAIATRLDLKILLANAEELQKEQKLAKDNIELAVAVNNLLNEMIKNEDGVGISNYFRQNPSHIYFVQNKQLRLLWSGSETLRIGDIKKMLLTGVSEKIIIQLVKRSNVPYVEFSLEEISTLKGMGISDDIIAAMMEVTNEILKDEKRLQEFKTILEKQKTEIKSKNYYKYEYNINSSSDFEGYFLNKLTDKLIDKMF